MKQKMLISVGAVLGIVLVVLVVKITLIAITKNPTATENIRTLLELASFASGPLVLIVAILGLRQLYFAQGQIDTAKGIFRKQSIRESFIAAANECRNFSDTMMPTINTIDKFIEDNKITIFQDAKIIETENGFKIDMSQIKPDDVIKLSEIDGIFNKYFNGMELFALHFVSRIADENIAFLMMGKPYVEEVEQMAVLLPLTNSSQDDFKAIWPLYFSWKARLQKQKLEKEKSEIESKLKTIKYEPKKAIGTE
jgi:hypothetical protein